MSAATGARTVLRTRSGLEAIDLGFAMARAWWRPLALGWLAFVLPMGIAIVWLLQDSPGWAIALLWWLRPAFARVPLDVLSRELFGERATLASTARALPRLLFASGLFTSLVTRRFSTSRTFLQPVLQLEGLRGRERNARAAVLARQDSGAAAALATVLAHVNGVIGTGLIAFVWLLTPVEIEWDVMEIVFGDGAIPALWASLYLVGMSVCEPLLVAGGFGLYVNRRVFLEGWEIELAFRRLAARAAAPESRRRGLAAAVLLALVLAAPAARASDCVPEDPASAQDCIDDVLAAPEFGGERKELRWMPKELDSSDTSDPDLAWLGDFAELLVSLARVLLYGGLAIAVLAVAFALRGVRLGGVRAPKSTALPATLMGLDLRPESLPENVADAAREAWLRGDPIAALSLLYRGALVRLAARGTLEVPESATEGECVRLVRRTHAETIASAFAALTRAWVRMRYGHEAPAEGEFLALCDGFAAFEARP